MTEVTDNTGNVVEKYTYDVYGTPVIKNAAGTILTTSAITNPHMFTGRRLDSETNLFYFRNRMYSSMLGRFLQRDPIGYFDSMNLYSYVRNNPVKWIDPFGLKKIKVEGETYYYHPNDADNLMPHVHKGGPNSPVKVNLETGDIYHKTKNLGKNVGKKTLGQILRKIPGIGFLTAGIIGIAVGDYNTPQKLDQWLRCKSMVKYTNPEGGPGWAKDESSATSSRPKWPWQPSKATERWPSSAQSTVSMAT